MAHLRSLWRPNTRLPSCSLFTHPIILPYQHESISCRRNNTIANPEQLIFRQQIKRAMEVEEDNLTKRLLSDMHSFHNALPSNPDKAVIWVKNSFSNPYEEETVRKAYEAIQKIPLIESVDDVDEDIKNIIDYALKKSPKVLSRELEEKVQTLESENKRLRCELEASRREKFNIARPNKSSRPLNSLSSPCIEVPSPVNREDTADDLVSKHFQAMNVVFQTMKILRKGHLQLEGKIKDLERENRRLKQHVQTPNDTPHLVNHDSSKAKQEDELGSNKAKTDVGDLEWEEKYRELEYVHERSLKEYKDKLKNALHIIWTLRQENFRLNTELSEVKKTDNAQESGNMSTETNEPRNVEPTSESDGMPVNFVSDLKVREILQSLNLEAVVPGAHDFIKEEQVQMEGLKADKSVQESNDVERIQSESSKEEEETREDRNPKSPERP